MAGKQVDPASTSPVDLALHAALRDFHASPGRYHVGRRQPEVLFSSIREILHLAIGRTADDELRRAAGFFTRSVLLHPGSDHYGLLGLDRSADAAAIKDRYRLMMRLLHPDFTAAEPGVWPASAPARVNLAYGVLSSPLQRRDYDASLAAMNRPAPGPMRRFPPAANRPPRRSRGAASHGARKGLRTVVVICGVTGFVLVFATLLLGGSDVVQLVRRAPPSPPQAVATAPTPEALRLPHPRPVAGVTLAEAQPLLATLLQHVQSGSGERLLDLLDRDARTAPAAQALSRQLDALAEGARPMKLAQVQFRAEPADGRLYVIGHMQLHADGAAAAPAKTLSLRVELASRGGTVVMTGLTGLGGN